MRKTIYLIFTILSPIIAQSQQNIALGTWRTHSSYYDLDGVIEAGTKIYGYNTSGLFYYDQEDNSLNKISKLDGLSRMDISTLAYSDKHETLLVAYNNGDVDLISESEIKAFRLISQSPLAGSKKINQILALGDYAYLLSDFGVTLVSIKTGQIKESYLNLSTAGNPLSILQGVIFQDSLFLVTPSGIMAGALVGNVNLQDFNNWRRFPAADGLPSGGFQQIVYSKQKLYTLKTNSIYQYQNGTWTLVNLIGNPTIQSISAHPQGLLICQSDKLSIYNEVNFTDIQNGLISGPQQAIIDSNLKLWVADTNNGLLTNQNVEWESFTPQGPNSNQTYSLNFLKNQVLALPCQRNINPSEIKSGFSTFKDGIWTSYKVDSFENITDVAYFDGLYHFSSMRNGLLTWDGELDFKVTDANQSGVTLNPTQDGYVLVSTLETNRNDKIWMINYQASNTLHSKTTETWEEFTVAGTSLTSDLLVPFSGHLWMKGPSGITIYDAENDTTRTLGVGSNDGRLPNGNIYDMAEDQDGYVWVTTGSGVAYFNNIYSAFTQNMEAIKPIYSNQYLFSEKIVSHVLIDPANRKWFVTAEGIWVFNALVDTILYHFNVENSPLPSNEILDMAFDSQSGEVFISTTSGIVSYRDGSTAAGLLHTADIMVFPNPVAPNFSGLVGISGLANNAFIKITDVSGRLVFETRAQGGTAVWDVHNLNGQKVNTGIYLVLSSTADGADTIVAKIAVVN